MWIKSSSEQSSPLKGIHCYNNAKRVILLRSKYNAWGSHLTLISWGNRISIEPSPTHFGRSSQNCNLPPTPSLRVRITKSILRPQLLVGTCVAQFLCLGYLHGDSSLYLRVLHQRKVAVDHMPSETLLHPLSRLPILDTCLLRSVKIERRLRTQVSVSPDGIFHHYLDSNFRINTQCTKYIISRK